MPHKKHKNRKKRKRRHDGLTAATADRHELYEKSVQEPEADCDFVEQAWRELRGRAPQWLREDFCGTAITAIEWVKRDPGHHALGIDIDPGVLEVARKRMQKRLKPAARGRLELVEGSVLDPAPRKVDCVLATNFSYFVFKTRRSLKGYFRKVREGLVEDGIAIFDTYGGHEASKEMREPRKYDGYTYVWDQAHFNPITHDVINHIHFRFPDGTKLMKAFTYEWRFWTLPELTELLEEAGFSDVVVYWEGTDEETGEGDGIWTPAKTGDTCPGWIAYLAAIY